jgi:hypothetical protein
LYFELGPEATSDEWRAAADYMIHRFVEAVYIVPGAGDNEMFRYLAQSGVNMMGGKNNLQEISDQWVMSLGFDLLQSYDDNIVDFVSDSGERTIEIPLRISAVNHDLLSLGRLRLVEEIMQAVFAGYIDLGITDQ